VAEEFSTGEPHSRVRSRIQDELEQLRDESQFRELEILRGVNLSSNDYLGLATRPEFKRALLEAVSQAERMGSTGSRLLSGNAREWDAIESKFADFAGTEAALYFGSGYAANVGLLSSILRPGDTVFSDECNHASLIDGMRLSGAKKVVYPHLDLGFLTKALADRKTFSGAKVIATESLFSMEGDVAPLDDLLQLAQKHGAELVVDEAHAVGVYGPQGRGLAAEFGIEREALATVLTCGKAFSCMGAFICGSSKLKEFLINKARTFIFTTAASPYMAGQIHAALEFARTADAEREHLRRIAGELRQELRTRGLNCGHGSSHIVPVMLGSNELALHVAEKLRQGGFAVKAIRPPTVPAGSARVRLSLTSRITRGDVQRLVSAISAAIADESTPLDSCLSASS
jgi:8-amino-7-oxononanoate synthase